MQRTTTTALSTIEATIEATIVVIIAATLFGGAFLITLGDQAAQYGVVSGATSTSLSFGLVLRRIARTEAKVAQLETDIARHDDRLVNQGYHFDDAVTRNARMTTALYEQHRDWIHKGDHPTGPAHIRRIY